MTVTSSNEKPGRLKTERLEARLSKEQKELNPRAADVLGLTKSRFCDY
jgi:uncharacterized protein (DUF1778 family)